MDVPTWILAVVLASSLSLIVTLVQRWRRRLNAEKLAESLRISTERRRQNPADIPPFGPTAAAGTRAPPYELIMPPSRDGAPLAWWRKLDGSTTFWLCRVAGTVNAVDNAVDDTVDEATDSDSGWWLTWFAPWRRGLPERLWIGTTVPAQHDGALTLCPGLEAAWRGATEPPTVLHDVALWQEASLCGLDFELVAIDGGVALRAVGGRMRDRFDLGCLASLGALIQARLGDGVLPSTWDVPAVQLRQAKHTSGEVPDETGYDALQVWGDLPPFGGLLRRDDGWRFEGRVARNEHGDLLNLWPHGAAFEPLRTCESGVIVRLGDGSEAELRALDGRPQRLAEQLLLT